MYFSIFYAIGSILYTIYEYLKQRKRAVNFTIDGVSHMPLQAGKKTTYKIQPRDAGGNKVDSFVAGTPTPTWPGQPPATDALFVVAPDGMSADDTPVTINQETISASVVIAGTAVTKTITPTPLPGDAVDFTIDEVVS